MDAEVLPVDAQATRPMPSRFACVTPLVMPRSLKEPVGFSPSCLRKILSTPAKSASRPMS